MELAAGTRVGPYEIQRKIGAGGMGVVYRALDSRLGRAVAIKVLPGALRDNAERLRRFEQEARTIGGLNHPNLVTLHDVGHHDGAPYLVTELLDGQSLRARLVDGPIAIRQCVHLGAEIARGLAAAHGAGVVHRDIKPDNVFVMTDGRVKILDFGIAKLRRETGDERAGGGGDLGSASTLGGDMGRADTVAGAAGRDGTETGTGIVIGTPGYMAPEQLAGAPVDARTDIFAFGVVLFEMLARKRPFAADSTIEESYAILKAMPGPLPGNVPASVARVVRRCLEKRPEARFQSSADLAFALETLEGAPEVVERGDVTPLPVAASLPPHATGKSTVPLAPVVTSAPTATDAPPRPIAEPGPAPRRARSPWLAVLAVACAGLAIALGAVLARGHHPAAAARTAPPPPAAIAAATAWPPVIDGGPAYRRVTFRTESDWYARFSADGKAVIHSVRLPKGSGATKGDDWEVVRTQLDPLTTSDLGFAGRVLDVSPSDEVLLRLAERNVKGGKLARRRSRDDAPAILATEIADASWGPRGAQIAATRIDARGTRLELPLGHVLVSHPTGELLAPRVSRDGALVAVIERIAPPDTRGRIAIYDAVSGALRAESAVLPGVEGVAWSGDGREAWYSAGTELRALALDGHDRVVLRSHVRLGLKDVARDGRVLVAPDDARMRVFELAPDRARRRPVERSWLDAAAVQDISRDGHTVALALVTGVGSTADGYQLAVRGSEADGQPGKPTPLGSGAAIALVPGAAAALVVTETGELHRVTLDPIATTPIAIAPVRIDPADVPSVSADGRLAVVAGAEPGQPEALWLVELTAGGAAPRRIGDVTPAEHEHHPISPDGRQIAIQGRLGFVLVDTATGRETPVAGAEMEMPLRFADDGKSLFVVQSHGWPRMIQRVDLAAPYRRDSWVSLAPFDKPRLAELAVSGDGSVITYSYSVDTSDLYVIEPPPVTSRR